MLEQHISLKKTGTKKEKYRNQIFDCQQQSHYTTEATQRADKKSPSQQNVRFRGEIKKNPS